MFKAVINEYCTERYMEMTNYISHSTLSKFCFKNSDQMNTVQGVQGNGQLPTDGDGIAYLFIVDETVLSPLQVVYHKLINHPQKSIYHTRQIRVSILSTYI